MMGPSLVDHYFDGPTVVLSPPSQFHAPDRFSNGNSPIQSSAHFPNFTSSHMNGVHAKSSLGLSENWMTGPSSKSLSANPSRKRSRDEFTTSDNNESSMQLPLSNGGFYSPTCDLAPDEQPVYGEGMAILNPRTGLVISAESQTGTWFEQKAQIQAEAFSPKSRPVDCVDCDDLPSRKTQRIDATASTWDDITALSVQNKLNPPTDRDTYPATKTPSTSTSLTSGPESHNVDDATYLLGISWQRMITDDKDVAAAIHGWEKFINNHFSQSMQNSQILLKHRGLNMYLVASYPTPSTGFDGNSDNTNSALSYFLFNDDLSEAQLVAQDWKSCIERLRSVPISFPAGSEVLRASERTPERQVEEQGIMNGAVRMNGCVNGIVGAGTEMQMDID
ncbi:hypothetical protein FQN57_007070 [Myotisia sp. PD_48]|nr:hypothetical protein FQN57_007070 [Myotisia sp. PD_48]